MACSPTLMSSPSIVPGILCDKNTPLSKLQVNESFEAFRLVTVEQLALSHGVSQVGLYRLGRRADLRGRRERGELRTLQPLLLIESRFWRAAATNVIVCSAVQTFATQIPAIWKPAGKA